MSIRLQQFASRVMRRRATIIVLVVKSSIHKKERLQCMSGLMHTVWQNPA